jgi:hypothetical protein
MVSEALPLSEDLLRTMRTAAKKAIELREPHITPRAILLALLDDPAIGPALLQVVNKEKVTAAETEDDLGAPHDDTLAFKTPDGRTSLWLSRDAHNIFIEGAQRVEERYYPKQLALGLAAQARLAPGILAAIRVEPGSLTDAIYKL